MEENSQEKNDYKERIKKELAALVVGKKDYNGYEILSIYVRGDEFVIYEIKTSNLSESVKVYIDTFEAEDPKGLIKKFSSIRAAFAEFKGVIYKIQNYSSYKSVAAHLISNALYGNVDESIIGFKDAVDNINKQYAEQFKYKLYYINTSLFFVFINLVISVAFYLCKWLPPSNQLLPLIYVATGGSIGGFISVSRKTKDMVFEKDVKLNMFIYYALERIFISIFGAVVVYFAIRSNLIFGLVQKLKQPLFGYILFSIAAGFSETLVPNLLIKLEEKQK